MQKGGPVAYRSEAISNRDCALTSSDYSNGCYVTMLSGKNTHVRSGVSGKIRFCSVSFGAYNKHKTEHRYNKRLELSLIS